MVHHLPKSIRRRHGFTLVELLVVIAILAILASLVSMGAFVMVGRRHANNTQATIRVINKLMQDRWTAVIADSRKEAPSQLVLTLAGNDPERAKVIWTKVRLAEAFPISYREMDPADANTIVNKYIPAGRLKPHFTKYRATITIYPAVPGKTESSACLLMALSTLGSGGGVSVPDHLNYAISDTDNDTVPEFIDSWGNPLAFFRFPWNNTDLQGANPAPAGSKNAKFADPIDNGGTLLNKTWYQSGSRLTFEAQFLQSVNWPNQAAGATPTQATFVIPVIVSAGPDGQLGLNADLSKIPPAPTNFETDNIYSYKLKGD